MASAKLWWTGKRDLVPFEPHPVTGFPTHPDQFARDLGTKVSELLADPQKCRRFGDAGRKRVEEIFSWTAIADETIALYRNLIERKQRSRKA